jgi:hypothetical protein
MEQAASTSVQAMATQGCHRSRQGTPLAGRKEKRKENLRDGLRVDKSGRAESTTGREYVTEL